MSELSENFPHNKLSEFKSYPFSNEFKFSKALDKIKLKSTQPNGKTKVALLFGESYLLSLLPELYSIGIRVIISADINPDMAEHIKHMLLCLGKAKDRKDFIKLYNQDNPIENKIETWLETFDSNVTISNKEALSQTIKGDIGSSKKSLKKYHFLSSEKRFNECKIYAKKLMFSQIHLDITHDEQCAQLARLLRKNNCEIALCNFTNIHDYFENILHRSTQLLLQFSPAPFIMYSISKENNNVLTDMNTTLSESLDSYFTEALKKEYKKEKIYNNINPTWVSSRILFLEPPTNSDKSTDYGNSIRIS